jgi:hypothetical protein
LGEKKEGGKRTNRLEKRRGGNASTGLVCIEPENAWKKRNTSIRGLNLIKALFLISLLYLFGKPC